MHELRIEIHREQQELSVPFHQWLSADGSIWCSFHRSQNGFLLRFPNQADFKIYSDGSIVQCWPMLGVATANINQLYLNQILPLVQSHSGELVFHASSIAVNDHAIVFVGTSGRGKSTLAASFSNNHYQFLTDDGLLIQKVGTLYQVAPSHPSIRLWEDSQLAILGDDVLPEAPLDYTSKLRFPATNRMLHCEKPCKLHRVYFLGDKVIEEVKFTKLTAQEAMVELIKHSFLLDVEDRRTMSSHFSAVSKMCTLDIYYRLDYPRHYDQLANTRRIILEHAGLNKICSPIDT